MSLDGQFSDLPSVLYSGSVDVFLSYLGRGPGRFYVQRADTSLQGRSSANAASFVFKKEKPGLWICIDLMRIRIQHFF
jgi:hypothetical protein